MPDPFACLTALADAGVVKVDDGTVVVVYIDQHIPPPGDRPDRLLPRKRRNTADYRRRECEDGRHTRHCPSATCPEKQQKRGSPPG